MKDLDIIDDYKQPSDEEIEKSQNFSELIGRYNTSNKKKGKSNNRIKLFGGTIFLFAVVAILSYLIFNKPENHKNAVQELRPKTSELPVIKDSVFENKALLQEKDTLTKPVQERTISIKEKSSRVKYTSVDTTTHLAKKDSVHNTVTKSLLDKPVKTDSIIDLKGIK